MIYSRTDFHQEMIPLRHMLSTGSRERMVDVTPRVVEPDKIITEQDLTLTEAERERIGGSEAANKKRFNELVGKQPSSLDIKLTDFTDLGGNPLPFPFAIPAGGEVVGYTPLDYHSRDSLLCVDTRSGYARARGLACTGFQHKGGKNKVLSLFGRHSEGRMSFLEESVSFEEAGFILRNYSPNTLRIPDPFSPVQVYMLRDVRGTYNMPHTVRLEIDGEDVTRENTVQIGNFMAYRLHLSGEVNWMKDAGMPVDIEDKGMFESLIIKNRVENLPENVNYCLTQSKEIVHTNGHPVYILPVHYIDVMDNRRVFDDRYALDSFFQRAFRGEYVTVTTNSGVHNPKAANPIVFECVPGKGEIGKYFRVDEPFALAIPVPFYDGGVDTTSYIGSHLQQNHEIDAF